MTKRILAILLTTATFTAAFANYAPSLIDDVPGSDQNFHPWYAQIAAGVSLPTTDKWKNENDNTTVSSKYKMGYTGNLSFGYRFNKYLRAEVEGLYIYNSLNKITFTGFDEKMNGKAYSGSLMANGYFDIANTSIITPYIGVGAGFTYSYFQSKRKTSPEYSDSGHVTQPALQGIVGINFNLTPAWLLGINYSYLYMFGNPDINFKDKSTGAVTPYKIKTYDRSTVNLSLSYRF